MKQVEAVGKSADPDYGGKVGYAADDAFFTARGRDEKEGAADADEDVEDRSGRQVAGDEQQGAQDHEGGDDD